MGQKPFCKAPMRDTIRLEEYKKARIDKIMMQIGIFKHTLGKKLCLLFLNVLCEWISCHTRDHSPT